MSDELTVNPSNFSGLELARYVLGRLTNDQSSIEKIAKDFDRDKEFISGIIKFLKDIGWIQEDQNGSYQVTRKGQANTIVRKRPIVNFRTKSL
jgi:hypothetical protein